MGRLNKIYWGLMNRREKKFNEADLRSRIARIDRELYNFYLKRRGTKRILTTTGLKELLERGGLNLTTRAIRYWVEKGELSYYQIGNLRIFRKEDLKKWLKRVEKKGMRLLAGKGKLDNRDIEEVLGR